MARAVLLLDHHQRPTLGSEVRYERQKMVGHPHGYKAKVRADYSFTGRL
jgi:hypothetical protein